MKPGLDKLNLCFFKKILSDMSLYFIMIYKVHVLLDALFYSQQTVWYSWENPTFVNWSGLFPIACKTVTFFFYNAKIPGDLGVSIGKEGWLWGAAWSRPPGWEGSQSNRFPLPTTLMQYRQFRGQPLDVRSFSQSISSSNPNHIISKLRTFITQR